MQCGMQELGELGAWGKSVGALCCLARYTLAERLWWLMRLSCLASPPKVGDDLGARDRNNLSLLVGADTPLTEAERFWLTPAPLARVKGPTTINRSYWPPQPTTAARRADLPSQRADLPSWRRPRAGYPATACLPEPAASAMGPVSYRTGGSLPDDRRASQEAGHTSFGSRPGLSGPYPVHGETAVV